MYKIKNITNGKVILGDLNNLILKRDEEIDLDGQFTREAINASRDLASALNPKRTVLAVLHKDVPAQPTTLVQTVIHPSMIEAMVRKAIADMGVGEKKDLSHDKLDAILAAISGQARSDVPQEKLSGQIHKDTSVDIQTRLIKRLSNNVEANVEAKTETKESADVKKNADDLGNLLNGDM